MGDMLRTINDFVKFLPVYKLSDKEITLIAGLLSIDNGHAMNIISSCYPVSFCASLKKYLEIVERLPNLDNILAGNYPKISFSFSEKYAIATGLVHELNTLYDSEDEQFYEKMDCWLTYIQTLPPEFAVSGIRDILSHCKDINLVRLKNWCPFAKKYTTLLST